MVTAVIIAIAMALLYGKISRHQGRLHRRMMRAGPLGVRGLRRRGWGPGGLLGWGMLVLDETGRGEEGVGPGEGAGSAASMGTGRVSPAGPAVRRGVAGGVDANVARVETPLEALQRRFAAGEIEIDQYEREVGRLYGVREN